MSPGSAQAGRNDLPALTAFAAGTRPARRSPAGGRRAWLASAISSSAVISSRPLLRENQSRLISRQRARTSTFARQAEVTAQGGVRHGAGPAAPRAASRLWHRQSPSSPPAQEDEGKAMAAPRWQTYRAAPSSSWPAFGATVGRGAARVWSSNTADGTRGAPSCFCRITIHRATINLASQACGPAESRAARRARASSLPAPYRR